MKERLDQILDTALNERRIVGAVLLVEERGAPVYGRAIGLSDREAGRGMKLDTRFRLASVTKPILSTLFMTLAEDGVFSLSDPVTDYLPEFRPALPNGHVPEITLHHLLTHSSGLGYRFLESETGPYACFGVSDGLDQPGLGMAENLRRISRAPLYFEPGTGWRYSVGMDVLGAVAEVATGEPLQTLLDRRIAAPLGLQSLRFHEKPAVDFAQPYLDGPSGPVRMEEGVRHPLWGEGGVRFAPSRVHDPASFPSSGAGLVGTAPEVMTVLRCLLTGGAPVLRLETVAQMMKPQLPQELWTMHGPGWSFGYGWGVLADPKAAGVGLPSGTMRWGGVYGHSWFMDPVSQRVSLLLTNTAYEGMIGKLAADIPGVFYS
ncbi:serine hydrolase domain-containing protein [Aliiroseovarius sp. F20344]|uniref:serine hydrolase domain-containing protein n=1 Tax=Aliiroseovarius sp. F20344 TaxID=2926414 RepID=UPI001FF0F728|nr:serine hydrolase domain-containing protein [Aliiroseovarius sp. F20344]MCK0142252.1 beta-lactamase family protein [Aliiroseovarius sp. F20344]